MGLTSLRNSQLAAVVTSLEMLRKPLLQPQPMMPFRLIRWKQPSTEAYRALFQRVGQNWLWFSRLILEETRLRAILDNENVQIFAVIDRQNLEVGLLELDFRIEEQCEIAYFGVIPELTGKGVGAWLMSQALALGWRKGIKRVWVHTCSLDHPSALKFYMAHGFTPYAREIEIFDDPRLTGIYPSDCAAQIPLLQPGSD